jgi:hypothetical protein
MVVSMARKLNALASFSKCVYSIGPFAEECGKEFNCDPEALIAQATHKIFIDKKIAFDEISSTKIAFNKISSTKIAFNKISSTKNAFDEISSTKIRLRQNFIDTHDLLVTSTTKWCFELLA